MNRRRFPTCLVLSTLLALALSACLPEGVRVPQSPLSAILERKTGLIAYLSSAGNIYTIDQGAGHKTNVTTDAFADEKNFMSYALPTWSPASQLLPSPPYPA